jgi:hypothetical protein
MHDQINKTNRTRLPPSLPFIKYEKWPSQVEARRKGKKGEGEEKRRKLGSL